jgi:hypothetical protein
MACGNNLNSDYWLYQSGKRLSADAHLNYSIIKNEADKLGYSGHFKNRKKNPAFKGRDSMLLPV